MQISPEAAAEMLIRYAEKSTEALILNYDFVRSMIGIHWQNVSPISHKLINDTMNLACPYLIASRWWHYEAEIRRFLTDNQGVGLCYPVSFGMRFSDETTAALYRLNYG